jgi:hypothetical protein
LPVSCFNFATNINYVVRLMQLEHLPSGMKTREESERRGEGRGGEGRGEERRGERERETETES